MSFIDPNLFRPGDFITNNRYILSEILDQYFAFCFPAYPSHAVLSPRSAL